MTDSEGSVHKKPWLPQKVQRWHIKQVIVDPLDGMGVVNLVEEADGEVVMFADYAALEAECKRYREALEDIKFWCETTTCEICGGKEMSDTDCYDYVMEALGGQDADK